MGLRRLDRAEGGARLMLGLWERDLATGNAM
jgi:hypothetical protein